MSPSPREDLVDDDWLELATADVEDTLKGTVLEGAQIIPVSAQTGEGLPELVSAIESMIHDIPEKRDLSRPRLPIDRSFTITGFGTVVTGTLIDGHLETGQDVELAVAGQKTRVRGLQTHKNRVDLAEPGTRVAANLIGVPHDGIFRGEVLTAPGWLRPTTAFDVHLRVLEDAPNPLRHNMYLTVHTGSSESVARLRLLEDDRAQPGSTTWAQLKLDDSVAVAKGDYFVIRSNMTTLGGGNIVDTHAPRPRRRHSPTIERLQVMEQGSDREVLLKTIEGLEPAEFRRVVNRANLDADTAKAEIEAMTADGQVIALGGAIRQTTRLYTAGGWRALEDLARTSLGEYHRMYPLRSGAPKEELRSRLKLSPQVFNDVMKLLDEAGVIHLGESSVRLPGHTPSLADGQRKVVDDYLHKLDSEPFSPPTDIQIDSEVINLLDVEGKVVKVSETVVFSASAYQDMVDRISAHLGEHGEITVADVRDLFGTSRKYALALMDHLDHVRITRRVGDVRVLR